MAYPLNAAPDRASSPGTFNPQIIKETAHEHAQAKTRVAVFTESLGLRTMDIGLLPMARTLEHVCLLSLGLLAHSIKHTNFSIGVSFPG